MSLNEHVEAHRSVTPGPYGLENVLIRLNIQFELVQNARYARVPVIMTHIFDAPQLKDGILEHLTVTLDSVWREW